MIFVHIDEYVAVIAIQSCLQCQTYDTRGIGFVADTDNCGSYHICVRSEESGKVTQLDSIPCPCGAMFNTSTALSGAPCIQADERCPNAMVSKNKGKLIII